MSVGKNPFDQMSVDKISVDNITVDKMAVDNISVDITSSCLLGITFCFEGIDLGPCL